MPSHERASGFGERPVSAERRLLGLPAGVSCYRFDGHEGLTHYGL